jgi:uncharacterized LabA/DUF88 family protein
MAPDMGTAQVEKIVDYDWKLDFGKLYEVAGGETVGRAVMYGSKPPANDSLWRAAEHQGFEVIVFDRNANNREKKIDTQIATDIVSDSYQWMDLERQDEVRLVAGDGDYVPVIENLRERGFDCIVVFWSHASRELKEAATEFIELDQHLAELNRG